MRSQTCTRCDYPPIVERDGARDGSPTGKRAACDHNTIGSKAGRIIYDQFAIVNGCIERRAVVRARQGERPLPLLNEVATSREAARECRAAVVCSDREGINVTDLPVAFQRTNGDDRVIHRIGYQPITEHLNPRLISAAAPVESNRAATAVAVWTRQRDQARASSASFIREDQRASDSVWLRASVAGNGRVVRDGAVEEFHETVIIELSVEVIASLEHEVTVACVCSVVKVDSA